MTCASQNNQYILRSECLPASYHITSLTQFKQCDAAAANDHHPHTAITCTNYTDGMGHHPCHTVWHVVDLEEMWVGEVLSVSW